MYAKKFSLLSARGRIAFRLSNGLVVSSKQTKMKNMHNVLLSESFMKDD